MAEIGEGRFGDPDEGEDKPRKFTVVDKRFQEEEEAAASSPTPAPEPPKEARTIKVDLPGPATTSSAATAPAPAAASAEESGGAPPTAPGDPDPLAISNALLFFIEELFTRVLIFLGLTPNPQTGLTVRNFEQAQRGIQVLEVLIAEARKDTNSPEVDAYLTKLVTQLKAAYVQLVTGGSLTGPGGPGAGPGGASFSGK